MVGRPPVGAAPALLSPGPSGGLVATGRRVSPMPQIIIFILFIAVVYMLLLRPQKQRVRRQQELITAIDVGDQVVTAGGLIGRVAGLTDERLLLEVADGTQIELLRLAISRKLEDTGSPFFGPAAEELEEVEDAGELEAVDEPMARSEAPVLDQGDLPVPPPEPEEAVVVPPPPSPEPEEAVVVPPPPSPEPTAPASTAPAPGQDQH
jgi:preprotein translocase subunit YajC